MSGGSATTSGTTFQEELTAWFACLVLADTKAPSVAGLPSTTVLDSLNAETIQPVDDLKVITSADGQLFVQAKAGKLSCSESDERFVSAIGQFVKQFDSGYTPATSSNRELDEFRDRLILAVNEQAYGTVKNDLRDLLDTFRSCSNPAAFATARSGLSAKLEQQLNTLEKVIADQCTQLGIAPLSDEQLQRLLRFVHIVPLDFSSDGATIREAHALLKQTVLCDPARSDEAWDLLIATVRDFAPSRTGGDRRFFRQVLQQRDLVPRPVPSAARDIDALSIRSAAFEHHIEPFSEIKYKEQRVQIPRPVVAHLLSEAGSGDILLTGSAGAGKSGCLHEFVRQARNAGADVLLLAVDQLGATTFTELDQELGISTTHDLVTLLADWSGQSQAYLVIDALDAARTTHGLTSLCSRIQQIRRYAPRWKVVASIREFDLRHSRDIRQLFAGESAGCHTKPEFESLRHVHVTRLTPKELDEFAKQAPEVATVRDSTSAEFRELTRNPFNLRLLTELVEGEVDQTRLTQIRTQVGLLDLYWAERVSEVDQDGTVEEGLSDCVRRMVDLRSLSLSEKSLPQPSESVATWLDRLGSATVLSISSPPIPGGDRQISFVHNILYDYAVARLVLKEMSQDVIDWLGAKDNQDLLLAIRPSVVLTFQRLWHASEDRALFWDRALAFIASPSMRLIGKIIAADVAAIEYRSTGDIAPLLGQLASSVAEDAQTLLRFTLQAAIAHFRQDSQRFPLWGDDAPEWLGLAALLAEKHTEAAKWQVRSILAQLPSKE